MDNPRKKSQSLTMLMLPWLAHGHANRYLELGKRLTQELNNLSVHLCSTPIILGSIRDHPSNLPPPQTRISFIELHLPELAELTPHLHTTKHIPSHLIPALSRLFAQSEQTFSNIIDTVKPDLLIFDIFQPWAAKLAHERNIPAVLFIGCTVAMSFYAHEYFTPCKEFPFPAIRLTQDDRRENKGHTGDECIRNMLERVALSWKLSDFVITKSFREIESKYIDYLSTLIGKEVVSAGPLVPDISSVSPGDNQEEEKVMQWLDRRERRSVVFASFGSEYFMSYKEMDQLGHGLELSGACFILVARFAKYTEKKEEVSAMALLHGLVERVGAEKGLVVTSWAPQRKILLHPNLGLFLTHCGWSSVIEGIQAGVPMLALPMNWDQPMNAKLIVQLGVGMQILQRGLGNFTGEDVATSIGEILQSENGECVRKNAEELAELIRDRKDYDIRILADKILQLVTNVEAASAV